MNNPSTLIQVIDDDPSIVNMLRENFELEGYTVVCGFDGLTAIQLAKKHLPHLIVMDVNMPVTNGLEVVKSLRLLADTKHIPIILLTGEISKEVYPVLDSNTRIAHVKKTIDLESLNSLVREFLEKYKPV